MLDKRFCLRLRRRTVLICLAHIFFEVGSEQPVGATNQDIGCLLALPGNPQYEPGTIVDGNCAFDFDFGLPVDLPHCPASVPIALILMPKCASTSFLNWLATIDGTSQRWLDLSNSFHDRVHGRCNKYSPDGSCSMGAEEAWHRSWDLIRWISGGVPPRSTQATFDTLEGQAAIQYYYGQRFHRGLLPYPSNCIPCCRARAGGDTASEVGSRIPVVAVRNPFSRLMAYFQRAWLGSPDKDLNSLADFPLWTEALEALHSRDVWDPEGPHMQQGEAAEVEVRGRRIVFSLEDLYHTRPVASVLLGRFPRQLSHDLGMLPSCEPAGCWLEREVFVVRMEAIPYDLGLLGLRLCLTHPSEGSFCGQPLPPVQRLNERPAEGREGLEAFWASPEGEEAAKRVVNVFALDFVLGGYGGNASTQLPLQPPLEDIQRWMRDSAR